MGKLKWHIILVIALWLVFCGMASAVELHVGSGQTYSTIRGAVDVAGDGDVIVVHAGSYTEHVSVAKRLTLLGEGADVVTVTAAVTSEHIFYVTADYVNISGFMVTGATGSSWISGFYLDNVEHCNISDNNASNNDNGIYLSHSSDNILMNNTVNSNNDHYGIELYQSSNNTLIGNTASNNSYGILLSSSSNNTLQNNTMSENTYNFDVGGSSSSLSDYLHDIDTSNTVDGKPIYYWVDQEDKQIPGDAGFVEVVNSTNITVSDLTKGVSFVYTVDSRIENVTGGIYLKSSNNNTIANSNASNNGHIGIYLHQSSNNTLAGNTASNNNDGIWLSSSSNNTLVNNTANSNDRFGICLYSSSNNNTLTENTANENSWSGIYLMYSGNNNTFAGNTVSNNNDGILLIESSNNNNLSSNTISDNWGVGIYMRYSSNNYLEKNTVDLNKDGIYMEYSDNNIISCNWVHNNTRSGFDVSDSRYNTIENNNIMSNGRLQPDGSYHWNFDNGRYDVEARNNYWGTTNLTTIDASIYDDDESSYSGTVSFYPPACEPVPCAPAPEIHGDVNHDGKLSAADAVLALQMAVGSIDTDPAADMNSDGKITSLDALMILQAVAGNIEIG